MGSPRPSSAPSHKKRYKLIVQNIIGAKTAGE
jgi:hypothetical protein